MQEEIIATTLVPAYLTYEGNPQDDVRQKQILGQLDSVKSFDELHRLGWRVDGEHFSELMRVWRIGLTFEEKFKG